VTLVWLPGAENVSVFFEGVQSGTTPIPCTVSLDGIELPVDLTEYRHMSQDTLRDGTVTSNDQSEQLFNAQGAWARYRYTWNRGADQEFGDLREDADPFRFQHSHGVDVWDEYELKLLPTMTLSKSDATGTPLLCESGVYLFAAVGSELYRTTTTDILTDTWTAITLTGGGTIQALTTDGTDLIVAHSNGVDRIIGSATTSTAFGTDVTTNTHTIAFVGNRVLAGQANVLVEIGNTGTPTTIQTHYQSAFRWTTLFNIGSRIYIGGYAGMRSELYSVAVTSTGVLAQSVESAPLPAGELLNGALAVAGSVLLLTSKGVRMAQPGGDGTLTYGPLIDAVGDTKCATAEGRFAWVGWSAMRDGHSGCARLALDEFVSPLQPAYAADLETSTTTGTITSIAKYADLTVLGLSGSGIWVEQSDVYEVDGTLDAGIITFGTVENKVLTEIKVDHEPLDVGEAVRVRVYDDLDVLLVDNRNAIFASESFTTDLGGIDVRHCKVHIDLESDGTSTPTVKQWRMRAYPVVPFVEQWIVPLILHDRVKVNNGQGQDLDVDVQTTRADIVELCRTKLPVTYRIGERANQVRVDAFEWRPKKWSDAGNYMQGTMIVRLVKA